MGRASLALIALALAACGTRTGLVGEVAETPDAHPDAVAMPDEGTPEVVSDSEPPDVLPDAPPAPCTSDARCDDGIDCTVDRCDLAVGTCTHEPDNELCSPGFACRPPCTATSFAVDPSTLYGVDLPSGAVTAIGSTRGTSLVDIALDPHGVLYGVSNGLYTVDTKTGAPTFVVGLSVAVTLNALDFAPDGTLYGAGGNDVYAIDPKTGKVTLVATYPDGYSSSGDLAVIGNRLLATVNRGGRDHLVAIDLTTFHAAVIGSTGFDNIYGLASYGPQLFGFDDQGSVLQIDPATAESTLLVNTGIQFYGASAR
jgi:hypothetical protein